MTVMQRIRRAIFPAVADPKPPATLDSPLAAFPESPELDHEPVGARLSRLAQWCREGQLAAAELELYDWQRHEDCPSVARLLLAGLLTRRNQTDQARQILSHSTRAADDDSALGQFLICLKLASDLPDTARRLANQLYHHHGQDPATAAWLTAMEVPGSRELPALPTATIEHLATELIAQPLAIPTLVAAQQLRSDPATVSLLRQAIARAARDLDQEEHALTLCRAMAELALLATDADDARRWAYRGLKLNPHAASLALVLAQVADDETLGPPAAAVLETALAAQPSYPDLRAALIRREQADGRPEAARLRLVQWIEAAPEHPVARELAQELAA